LPDRDRSRSKAPLGGRFLFFQEVFDNLPLVQVFEPRIDDGGLVEEDVVVLAGNETETALGDEFFDDTLGHGAFLRLTATLWR